MMRSPTIGALAERSMRGSLKLMIGGEGAPTWREDVPNALTMSRVLAVPLMLCTFHQSPKILPAIIFGVCSLTDWLDGHLARRWQAHSDFGAFLDPVADKLLVCASLSLLSGAIGAVVSLPTAIIVCREVAVSALREWMGARGSREVVAVGASGKVKTAAQMVALQLLLLSLALDQAAMRRGGLLLLYVAALLSCTSAVGYFAAAWPRLVQDRAPDQQEGLQVEQS